MFNKKTYVINPSGGAGGIEGLLIKESGFKINIGLPESSAALSHSELYNINIAQPENNAALQEAVILRFTGAQFNEVNASLTETRNSFLRAWASTSIDNDSSRTTPTNANGQNNATTATIRTSLVLGDLTNPVILTSTMSGIPTTGTFTSKTIRVFYSIPARISTSDTLTFKYNVGAGDVTFFTHSGTTAVNNLTSGQTFDISGLTLTQLQTIQLKATYQASIVATPETQINLDSWNIELQGGL